MTCGRCNFYFTFCAIFCPFTTLTTWKIKLKKMKKKPSFFTHVPQIMIIWCMAPEIKCTMDDWTDEWEKRYIKVGALPKKLYLNLNEKYQIQLLMEVFNFDLWLLFTQLPFCQIRLPFYSGEEPFSNSLNSFIYNFLMFLVFGMFLSHI